MGADRAGDEGGQYQVAGDRRLIDRALHPTISVRRASEGSVASPRRGPRPETGSRHADPCSWSARRRARVGVEELANRGAASVCVPGD